MSEKKVVAFIVEGPSDEAALGSIMKEFFGSEEVRFVVVHGDITTKNYVSVETIADRINEQIARIKNRYRYRTEDFLKIIHITDTDGVFIPDENVREADVRGIRYHAEYMESKKTESTVDRNHRKAEILNRLRQTERIGGITYRVYYNSRNLEHVLYGELRGYSAEEKQRMSDDFAEKYEGRAEAFIRFISGPEIAAAGSYQDTWEFIGRKTNSLHRHSNMHLIFEDGCAGEKENS